MRLKSYYANSVEAAIRTARQELGEEAMLLNSRKTPDEARHLGLYEVVFATDQPEGAQLPAPAAAEPAPAPPGAGQAVERLSAEVEELRRQFEQISTRIARSTLQRSGCFHPWIEEVCAELSAAEVDPEIIYQIARKIGQAELAADPERTRQAVSRELQTRFSVAPLDSTPNGRRVTALIGPPGCGKTTTLVKMAALYGLTSRRPSQILSIDTHRIGAAEQLRSFAAILGMGFEALDTVGALAQALAAHERKEWIWIDTPGYGPRDFEWAPDLAKFLASRTDIETHLVLSCAAKTTDLSRVVDRFKVFRPARLIFTRLDETSTYGPIVNEAARAKLPVSFLTNGQRIPDDLEPATARRIVELVLDGGGRGEDMTARSRSPAAGRMTAA